MQLWRSRTSDRGSADRAALRLVGVGPGRVSSRPRQPIQSNFEGNADDRSLCLDQPERTENLHYARRGEVALQGAFRRCLEGRAVQSGFHQDQSELENSRNRRSRWAGWQALYRVRIRRDPDVSRREDRKIHAEGYGQKIRDDAVADVPAHQYRPNVRPIHPFQTVRAEGQCLFDVALSDRSEAPL